jgi:hypothetical protein
MATAVGSPTITLNANMLKDQNENVEWDVL